MALTGKGNFEDYHFHNILIRFDVLAYFPFTTGKTMRDYYLKHGIY